MTPFDCERLRDGLLAQPVNSLSALAFLAVAAFLWQRGRRDVAVLAASTGLGSTWFHAAPGGAASWAHDITLYGLIAIAAIELWRRFAANDLPVLAIGVFLVGLLFWSIGRNPSPFCHPDALLQWHAVWHVLAAGSLAILFAEEAEPRPAE